GSGAARAGAAAPSRGAALCSHPRRCRADRPHVRAGAAVLQGHASRARRRVMRASAERLPYRSVFVTGAGGHVGRQLVAALARDRAAHPELLQLIFRPGTILGAAARNQITDLLDGRWVLALRGASSPFVFAWDEDVVGAILHGIDKHGSGIFNIAAMGR